MRQRAGARRVIRERTERMLVKDEEKEEFVKAERTVELNDTDAEAEALISRLAVRYAQTIAHYMEYFKQDDKKKTYEMAMEANKGYLEHRAEQARETSPRDMEWCHLSAIASFDTKEALELWGHICDAAYSEVVSGFGSAEVVGDASPFERARFLATREYFMEGWNPQNGIERTLIDMLAQEYSLYLHWTTIAHQRSTRIVENHKDWQRQARDLGWLPPSQHVADSVEQAYRLADGYHRQFMRTLRQLRDMRRYKLIIQNPGQVNIGDQQINVSKP